jgi:hypothetical protein
MTIFAAAFPDGSPHPSALFEMSIMIVRRILIGCRISYVGEDEPLMQVLPFFFWRRNYCSFAWFIIDHHSHIRAEGKSRCNRRLKRRTIWGPSTLDSSSSSSRQEKRSTYKAWLSVCFLQLIFTPQCSKDFQSFIHAMLDAECEKHKRAQINIEQPNISNIGAPVQISSIYHQSRYKLIDATIVYQVLFLLTPIHFCARNIQCTLFHKPRMCRRNLEPNVFFFFFALKDVMVFVTWIVLSSDVIHTLPSTHQQALLS